MRNLSAIIAICVAIALISSSDAKRGGGFGSFGRGSSSRPSSSWSRPSPSYSMPSRPSPSSYSAPSYKPAPAPSPSYGWNTPSSSNNQPRPAAPAPSYGWNTPSSSNNQPRPAAPAPSYGWNTPSSSNNQPRPAAPAPSYGWNTPGTSNSQPAAPSYGWNVGGNAAPKPATNNVGWNVGGNAGSNVKPSAPVGPPPSYPGFNNRPVPGNNQPPAYSPSFNNPPSYSPSYNKPSYSPSYPSPSYSPSYPSNNYKPSYQQNSYSPSYSSRPSGSGFYGNNNYGNNNNNYGRNNYGNTFGSGGLPGNTYISNNYYGSQQRSGFGGSGFLTNALFFGAGMHGGYMWGNRNSHNDNYNRRNWNEEEDRRWRSTTKAPYFDNKVPGSDVILPAAAVVGAATAFGLISLLPLNVPSQKPLMYCNQNASDILQTQILINGNVYECINDTITISNFNCLKLTSNQNITNSLNETTTTSTESTPVDNSTTISATNSCEEKSKTLHCDGDESIYCVNGTLLSRNDIFCNSTTFINGTVNLNQSMMILNCYDGLLAERQVASIPTTTTTQAPTTTTEKSLSFKSKVHVFLLRLIGQGDSMKKPETTTTTEEPEIPRQSVDETLPVWVPEALTIPPETTEPPTTTPKMFWALKNSSAPVDELIGSSLDSTYETNKDDTIFKFYTRLISTTETPTTTPKMIWMFKNETGIDSKAMTDTSFLDRAYEKDKNDPIFEIYTKVVSTTESSDKSTDNSTATSV